MGKAAPTPWRQAPRFFELPAEVRMRTLCGRDARAVKMAAADFGWKRALPTGAQ
jgi:hypothetical protein